MQIWINGKLNDFAPVSMTMADLVNTLNLTGKRIAIEQNGEIVPRGLYAETTLEDGDRLEIVGAVGGG